MENYHITAAQISASSQFDENYVPSHGRLNYLGDGGAWAAKDNDLNQWIQIDLRVEANVTFVATQTKYGDLYQRVTQYKLQYSKDGLSFQIYKQSGKNSDKVRVRMVFIRSAGYPQSGEGEARFKVAPYSFTIARALMTKAQVICARSKENFFDFCDVNMSTKSKTDSNSSRVSFGEFF